MFKKLKVALAALLLVATSTAMLSLTVPIVVYAGTDIGAGGSSLSGSATTQKGNNPDWSITQYITDRNGITTEAGPSNCIIGAHVTPMYCQRTIYDTCLKQFSGNKKKAVDALLTSGKFEYLFSNNDIHVYGAGKANTQSFYLFNGASSRVPTAVYTYDPNKSPVPISYDLYDGWIRKNNSTETSLFGTTVSNSQVKLDLSSKFRSYNANNIFDSSVFYAATSGREYNLYFYGSNHEDDLPSGARSAFEKMTNAAFSNSLGTNFASINNTYVVIWFVEPILSTEINLQVGTNDYWQPFGLTPSLLSEAVDVMGISGTDFGLGDMYKAGSSTTFVNFCHTNGYTTDYSLDGVSGAGAYCVILGDEIPDRLADMPEIPSIPIFYKDKDGKLTYSGSSSTVTKEAWNEIYPVLSYALHLSEDEPKSNSLYNDPFVKSSITNVLSESKQAKDESGEYKPGFLNVYNSLWTQICDHYSNTMIDVSTGSVPKRVNNNDPTNVISLPGDWDGPFEIDTTLGTVADTDKPINGKKATIYAAHLGNSDLEIVSKTTTSMSALPTEVGKSVSVADVLRNPYEYAIVIETGSDIVDEDGDPEPPNIVVYDEDQDTIWNTSIPKEDFNAFKTDLKYAKGFPSITWNDMLDANARAKSDLARNAFEVLMSKGSYAAYNENPRKYLNDSGWEQHAQGTTFEALINDSAAYYNSLTEELDHWEDVKKADEKLAFELNWYSTSISNELNEDDCVYHDYDWDVWHDHGVGNSVYINSSNPTSYYPGSFLSSRFRKSLFIWDYGSSDSWFLSGCERYNSSDSSWKAVYEEYMKNNFFEGGFTANNRKYLAVKKNKPGTSEDFYMVGTENRLWNDDGTAPRNYEWTTPKDIYDWVYIKTLFKDTDSWDYPYPEYEVRATSDPNQFQLFQWKYIRTDQIEHTEQWWTAFEPSLFNSYDYHNNPYGVLSCEDRIKVFLGTKFAEVQVNAYNDLKTQVNAEIQTISNRIDVLKARCTEYEEARIDYMKKLSDAEEALKDGFDVYLVQAVNGAGPNGAPQLENNVTDSLVKRNDSGNSTNQEGYKTWQSDLYMYNSLEFIENSDPKMMKYGALNTNTFAQNSNLDADVLNKGVFSSYAATNSTTSTPKTPYKLPEVNNSPIKGELDARVANSDRAKMPLRYRVVYSDSPYKHMDEDTIKAAASKSQVLTELTYDMLFDAPYSYGIILNGVKQTDDKIEIKEYEINYVKNSSLSKYLNKLFFSSDNTVTMDSTTNNSVSTTKRIKSFTYEPDNKTYITTKFDTSTDRIPHLWLSENSSVTASFDKTDSNDNSDDSRPTDNNNSIPSVLQSNYNSNYKTLNNDKTTAALFIDSLWKNETTNTVETSTSELLKTYITNNSYRSNYSSNSIYGDEFLNYDCANGTEFDFWRTQCSEGLKLATVYRMYKSRYNTAETKSNSNEGVPQPVGNNGAIPDGHSADSAGWVPVWATNPDDRTVDYMDYEVHISYQPTLKITSTFSTDDKDIKAMNGLTDNGVPYLKAGQAFEGEITGNRLIIDGYCNVGGNTDYIRGGTVDNLQFRDMNEFYAYMDAIVEDLSKCRMGIVSTIPEFNVYTNNDKINLGDNTSVKYSYDGTLGNTQADGDAGIIFKTHDVDSTNRTKFYSVYDVTNYGVKPKYAGTPNDSDYNSNIFNDNTKHDGCYYGSSTQSMYDSLLEHNRGTNGWYWEYSEGLYYVHYHAEINYNKDDTDGKKTFSAVISKYNSQSTDENADDYLLNQGSVKSGFTSAFGYVDNSQYRSLDGKDSYVLAPFIDLRDLTTDKARELFVNQSTGGNNLNGILGQQTPIHIRGNVYDNT